MLNKIKYRGFTYVKAEDQTVLERLEALSGGKFKPGRNHLFGRYPVDIDDQDPGQGLSVRPVDKDVATDLLKLLRQKGFKVSFDRKRKEIDIS